MIKNIIFDMGNVLIRFDTDVFIDRVGITDPKDREILKRNVYQSLEWARMDRGSLTDAEACTIISERVPERLRGAVSKLVENWDRPIIEVEGMYGLIRELKENGYRIYLLSNASFHQHDYWPDIPCSRFFDGKLISCDVHLVKPQPEIFLLFCQKFKLLHEECFFIDDSAWNIEGAALCGIRGAVFHGDVGEMRERLREAGVRC